jgi:hypothetical protein
MNYYAVTYLSDDGGIVTVVVRGWHAAAAERTVALIHGGSSHTAKLVEQGEPSHA